MRKIAMTDTRRHLRPSAKLLELEGENPWRGPFGASDAPDAPLPRPYCKLVDFAQHLVTLAARPDRVFIALIRRD